MSDQVQAEQNIPNDRQKLMNGTSSGGAKGKSRRLLTARERDARYDKYLADRNGSSRLDPCEPSLAGLTCGAIDTAVRLMKRSWRGGQRPSLKRVVAKVSKFCNLTPAQEEVLRKWLSWLIDRGWVLHERGRSPVVEWVQSKPPISDVWTSELAASWRSKIDGKVKADQNGQKASEPLPSASAQQDAGVAKVESQPRPVEAGAPSPAGFAIPPAHPRPIGDQSARSGPSAQGSGSPTLPAAPVPGGEPVRSVKPEQAAVPTAPNHPSSLHPAASSAMAVASSPSGARREMFEGKMIFIPDFPTFFFKTGAHKTNALLNAIKPNSFNEQAFRSAINALLHDQVELNEFCERGSQQRRFIKDLFTQIGVKAP
jgi:hypothetical protein